MNFFYKWRLGDTEFAKDKGTVFSCFAGGGGSSMGYKLAGFDVLGCNEVDPKMMSIYKAKCAGVVVTIKFLSCYFRVLRPLCYRRGFFICDFALNQNVLKIWQKNDKKNSLKFGGL